MVRVELTQYSAAEGLEHFRLNLSGAVNATIGNTSSTITIVDDDTPGVNVFSYGISGDIYTVAAATDVIVENPNGGIDLVLASVSHLACRRGQHQDLGW
ncbi:MAG: hypothetical protein IPO43_15425 [Rhodoferax sp.]|nr:hypothetical protein [Rhodoferax sp.]